MTLLTLLTHILHVFNQFGAAHAYATKQSGNGLVTSKHWLVLACHIPAHTHGVFHCTGWVRRP